MYTRAHDAAHDVVVWMAGRACFDCSCLCEITRCGFASSSRDSWAAVQCEHHGRRSTHVLRCPQLPHLCLLRTHGVTKGANKLQLWLPSRRDSWCSGLSAHSLCDHQLTGAGGLPAAAEPSSHRWQADVHHRGCGHWLQCASAAHARPRAPPPSPPQPRHWQRLSSPSQPWRMWPQAWAPSPWR